MIEDTGPPNCTFCDTALHEYFELKLTTSDEYRKQFCSYNCIAAYAVNKSRSREDKLLAELKRLAKRAADDETTIRHLREASEDD